METFEERKTHTLAKMVENDKSKKGSVDSHAKPLLDAINNKDDYYTTSSCSGRILLLHEPPSKKKNEYAWPIVTHDEADPLAFQQALRGLLGQPGVVWLRMQTVIIHVACRDLDAAQQLLDQFSSHGWKRSGIISTRNDVMVELLSVEGMDAPVLIEGHDVVGPAYVQQFISIANEKLRTVWEKIASATERVTQSI